MWDEALYFSDGTSDGTKLVCDLNTSTANHTGARIVGYAAQANTSFRTPIPNQASLDGLALNLQMWWCPPTATPGFQTSNGIRCTLGQGSPW